MTDAAPRRLKGRSSAETRSAVLDLIRAAGPVSRVDLVARSGLTEATISKIVRGLLDDQVVVEVGFARSRGGKRATLLALNDAGRYAAGVAIDESRTLVVICRLDGQVIASRRSPGTDAPDPDTALVLVAPQIERLLREEGIDRGSVIGVGVATGGRRGIASGAPVFDGDSAWTVAPTGEALRKRLRLPVIVENDANCAALGQFWAGGEAAATDFAVVYMAFGIGVGIIINGDIYRGRSGNAGELGHTRVEPDGADCWCGSRGCLETVGPPRGIARRALADPDLRRELQAQDGMEVAEVYRRVVDAANTGSVGAARLIQESADYIAGALLGLVDVLDLDRLDLIGPGFADAPNAFLETIRSTVQSAAFARDVHPVTIALGAVTQDEVARGAASVVLHSTLTPHYAAARL